MNLLNNYKPYNTNLSNLIDLYESSKGIPEEIYKEEILNVLLNTYLDIIGVSIIFESLSEKDFKDLKLLEFIKDLKGDKRFYKNIAERLLFNENYVYWTKELVEECNKYADILPLLSYFLYNDETMDLFECVLNKNIAISAEFLTNFIAKCHGKKHIYKKYLKLIVYKIPVNK